MTEPREAETMGLRGLLPPRVASAVEPFRRFLRPTLTFKSARAGAVRAFVASSPSEAKILNVGAGSTDYAPNVVNLDIVEGPNIDVVAPAERLPFDDEFFDAAVVKAALHQVDDADAALSELYRVLRPSGRLLVDVPFIQGFHAPRDSRRYTERGLRHELERHGFTVEGSGVAAGPASAFAWVLADFLALTVSFRSTNGYRIARFFSTFFAWPIKFLDVVLDRHPMAHTIASGVWAEARKTS